MNARRSILATLALAAAALALSSAPALALSQHPYLSQLTGFGNPTAVTVGTAGDLYVADSASHVVDRFDATGTPASFTASESYVEGSRLTGTPSGPFELPQGVAVNEATGDIYVSDGGSQVVDVFSASGAYLSQLTGTPLSAPVSGSFQDPAGLAVDQTTGDLYVTDPHSGVVDVFNASGAYVSQFGSGVLGGTYGESIAVDDMTGVAYVGDSGTDAVYPFSTLGSFLSPEWLGVSTPAGSFGGGYVYAGIDQSDGHVYVATTQSVVDEFKSSTTEEYDGQITGTPAGPFESLRAVAVDPTSGDVYVADASGVVDVFGPSVVVPDVSTEPASEVKPTSAVLQGSVSPDEAGPATCRFVWGTSAEFGHTAPCSAAVPSGSGSVSVHAEITGLRSDTSYFYRLQASNANGTDTGQAAQDREFKTAGPGIAGESTVDIASTSATLSAQIDPNGSPTFYYFQYGASSSYGTDVPAPSEAAPHGVLVGVNAGYQEVSVHLQGLQPGVAYHYHVVAVSELAPGEYETFAGSDLTFSTQAAGGESLLPDGRDWEMVTPPYKQGAGLVADGNEQGADIQAAEDGSAITYAATSPFVENPAGSRALEVTQVFSNRIAPGSWQTNDISTAHDEGATEVAVGHSAEYKLFSPDLSYGLVEPEGDTPLPPLPAGAEKTVYLRTAAGGYEALVTSANVPAGTKFGGDGGGEAAFEFITASPDLSHVVLRSGIPLTSTPGVVGGLYVWSEGTLQLASVLPDGTPVEAQLGDSDYEVRDAISSDGSRLVWAAGSTVEGNSRERIYMRDMTRNETIQVDAPQGVGQPQGFGGTQFATASSDDSRIFFTSPEHLTTDATANGSADLYEFELTSAAGQPLAGKLSDLTVDRGAGESAGVQGVIGASEDGTQVYFVAHGILGDGGEHGAEAGGENLYLASYDEAAKGWSAPVFIATLSPGDAPSWGSGLESKNLSHMTARVSPNGQYVAFMSDRSLTGYDNRDASSGVPDEEVFLYDASAGRLACVSCNPTGARPQGLYEGTKYEEKLVDYAKNWSERWIAGNVPGWDSTDLSHALYQPRYLSNSGRLFFNSSDALVPGDVNGKEDVYEYEPNGVGSCQGATHGQNAGVVFSESAGGCIGLITSGTSGEESAFLDASANGSDVFFLTLSRLVAQDQDTSLDVYDAHECGSSSPCAPPAALAPPPCTTGDACKPAPAPQPAVFGAPASETFSGAGNVSPASGSTTAVTPRSATKAEKLAKALKTCKKKPKRARAACESQARKRYGARSSRVRAKGSHVGKAKSQLARRSSFTATER
jgi:DNA-binding beta-propeller fold protein YncE